MSTRFTSLRSLLLAAVLLSACTPATPPAAGAPPLVRVEADQHIQYVPARQTSPYAILAGLGLTVSAEDEVWVDGARMGETPAPVGTPNSIVVRRAVTFAVDDGGSQTQLRSAAPTVGAALARAGYTLYLGDAITPALDTPLTPLAVIHLERSRPVTVLADGRTLQARTHRATVGDVLGDMGLALVGQDYSLPAAEWLWRSAASGARLTVGGA